MRATTGTGTKLLAALLAVSLWACGSDDDPSGPAAPSPPGQLLSNTGAEEGSGSPTDWASDTEGPKPGNAYVFEWSGSEAHSGSRSLKIELGSVTDGDAFAHWSQLVDANIPHGRKLVLEVAVKTDLSGLGAGFMVRADDDDGPIAWATTQGQVSITGTADWRTESTTLDRVPDGTTKLHVFIMMFPNTAGSVYFDDIELTHN